MTAREFTIWLEGMLANKYELRPSDLATIQAKLRTVQPEVSPNPTWQPYVIQPQWTGNPPYKIGDITCTMTNVGTGVTSGTYIIPQFSAVNKHGA